MNNPLANVNLFYALLVPWSVYQATKDFLGQGKLLVLRIITYTDDGLS